MNTVKSTIAIVAAAMTLSATSASAQSQWTGLYLGATAGYGIARGDGGGDSLKGFMGGLYGGYNYQMGQVLLGVEGDYVFGRASLSESFVDGGTRFNFKTELDDAWSIRARLGFLAAPNVLLYGTLGYGSFGITGTETNLTTNQSLKFSGDFRGLIAGGGLEMAFTRNITGRLEGLYTMGKGQGDMSGADANLTQIRAGIAYKF